MLRLFFICLVFIVYGQKFRVCLPHELDFQGILYHRVVAFIIQDLTSIICTC
uniref:Uncharacterized protein n=1 Tax=Anguilla anguilla TaxID=7936 RepID=A0A0E9PF41_ANGAN